MPVRLPDLRHFIEFKLMCATHTTPLPSPLQTCLCLPCPVPVITLSLLWPDPLHDVAQNVTATHVLDMQMKARIQHNRA